jgi:hypothetical protein
MSPLSLSERSDSSPSEDEVDLVKSLVEDVMWDQGVKTAASTPR